MTDQAMPRAEKPAIGKPATGWVGGWAQGVAAKAWAGVREGLALYRRHSAAEALHAGLSQLPDAELRRLGLERQHLYWTAWGMAEDASSRGERRQ
jgi:uncharacterized protein YjeT (DUF2065 family)